MTTTTLYRPDCEDETHRMITKALDILTDMRVRDEIVTAVKALPDHMTPELSWSRLEAPNERDTGTLLASLRLLLPSGSGIGERWFRIRFGWTDEEIARIVILMRLAAATLRFHAKHTVLDGTEKMLLRDAERVEDFARGWPFSIPPGGRALQYENHTVVRLEPSDA